MGVLFDFIIELGLEVVKDRIKSTKDKLAVRSRLADYLKRQYHYNLNCSKDEEIDFEGLSEYIRTDLIDEVRVRLFGDKKERDLARQSILNHAAHYARSKTKLSACRAEHMVGKAVDILAKYYRGKTNRDLLFLAAEVEDTIIDEMTNQHQELAKSIEGVTQNIDDTLLLSMDRHLRLASEGRLDEVEKQLATAMKAISSTHVLAPYYGYAFEGQGIFKSVPLSNEATKLYPPHLNVTIADAQVGNNPIQNLDNKTLSYAYRHQLPITFDVITAKKYLGDILDPVQHEAQGLAGTHVILKPPSFPEAFPCNVTIDGKIEVDYLLLRTKEIQDDGTVIITNEEQINFNFKVVLAANFALRTITLSITPQNLTNTELLQYRMFLKHMSAAQSVTLKALNENCDFVTVNNLPKLDLDIGKLNAEIAFLQKIVEIEKYFGVNLPIPNEITSEDHLTIYHLYTMIKSGIFHGHWNSLNFSFEVSDQLRHSIDDIKDSCISISYINDEEIELFGQTLRFLLLRRVDNAKIEDYAKVRLKIDVLDNNDIVKIRFISSNKGTFSDAFYSEESEQKLLYNKNAN